MKVLFFFIGITWAFSQPKEIKGTFKSTHLINQNTVEQLYKNTMEFRVGHRFGDVYYGISNLLGVDDGAITDIALDYGLTDNIHVGVTRESGLRTYGIQSKWKMFSQSRDGAMPVSVSLFGGYDWITRKGSEEESTLLQLIVGRKQTKSFSLQATSFYVQRFENATHNLGFLGEQASFGIGVSGRYKLTKRTTLIAEYSHLFDRDGFNKNAHLTYKYDTFSVGYNIEAAGHTFQLIYSNSNEISTTRTLLGANQKLFDRHGYLGFNMTRLFWFD